MIANTSKMDTPVATGGWRRSVVIGVAALAAFAAALVYVLPVMGQWQEADRSADRTLLRFAEVRRGDLLHDIAVQGRAVAATRPTLFSPSAGIASVLVEEGETVVEDQVLVRIESAELESRLRLEQATLDSLGSALARQELVMQQTNLENEQAVDLLEVRVAAARRALSRNEEMQGLGIVNVKDLETSRDELFISKLELRHAKQKAALSHDMLRFELEDAGMAVKRQELVVADVLRQVRDLDVRSPVTGLVATLEIRDRDAVVTGQPLVGIVDLEDLEIEVNIPEAHADDVARGVQATMTIENRKYSGSLTSVAPEVRGGQVTGRVSFAGGLPEGLRQNQRVSTRLVLDRRSDVLKIPRGPFLESGGGQLVYVVDDRFARRRNVEVGVISVTEVEILAGLREGDTIVLSDIGRFEGAEDILLTR